MVPDYKNYNEDETNEFKSELAEVLKNYKK